MRGSRPALTWSRTMPGSIQLQCSFTGVTGTQSMTWVLLRFVVTCRVVVFSASMQLHWRNRHSSYGLGSSSLRGHVQGRDPASMQLHWRFRHSRYGLGSYSLRGMWLVRSFIFYFRVRQAAAKGFRQKSKQGAVQTVVCDLLLGLCLIWSATCWHSFLAVAKGSLGLLRFGDGCLGFTSGRSASHGVCGTVFLCFFGFVQFVRVGGTAEAPPLLDARVGRRVAERGLAWFPPPAHDRHASQQC